MNTLLRLVFHFPEVVSFLREKAAGQSTPAA